MVTTKRASSTVWTATFLALAFLLAGCMGPGEGEAAGGAVPLGALLPLTGNGASFGEPALKGIRLAVEEINHAGGVAGSELQVIEGDTQFPNTQQAASSMQRLAGEGVPFVIGATASDSSAAAIEIANEEEVVLMSPGSTRPDLTGPDHGYFFRIIPSDRIQGDQAAGFLLDTHGADRAVVMYEQTAYGKGLKDVFVENYIDRGGEVLGEPIAWEHDESVYGAKAAEAVGELERGDGDIIWIAGQAPHIGNLIKAIRDQGFDGTIQASEALENPSIFDVAGEAVDGVLFTKTVPDEEKADIFAMKYEARWGESPGVFSAFAYDAAYVAAAAIEAVGPDGAAIKQWLADNEVADRVTSDTIRFNSNGDVATGGYTLWEVVYADGEGDFRPYVG